MPRPLPQRKTVKKLRSLNPSNVALGLLSCLAVVSCFGTETDNPVTSNTPGIDYTSPDDFGAPPGAPPPCAPPDPESVPFVPNGYGRETLLSTAAGPVLTQAGRRGLVLVDVSDPATPRALSSGGAPVLYDAVAGPDGVLWGVVSEPLDISGAAVPAREALDLRTRLLQLDVSDPTRPARVAQVDLDGEPWALRARGDALWVVTARRSAAQRACDAPKGWMSCGPWKYEALVVRGFRSNGGAFEQIAAAELPFNLRAWWGTDGLVSAAGGVLHVLTWDESGALSMPTTVSVQQVHEREDVRDELALGPVDVEGRQLRVVHSAGTAATLDVYDLDALGAPRSVSLGDDARASTSALFYQHHLWLQPSLAGTAAQVWDLSGAEPVRVALPAAYQIVLPIAGATHADAPPDEVLAIASATDTSGRTNAALLALSSGVMRVIEPIDVVDRSPFDGAPAGVFGSGAFPKWRISSQGSGLPLAIEPDVLLPPAPDVRGSVAVANDAGTLVTATLQIAFEPVSPGAYALEGQLVFDGVAPFSVSPEATTVLATRKHVVTLDTTDLRQCAQTGEDCSGRTPGVAIFTAADTPSLVATLPLPELPLPTSIPANDASVSWQLYDAITRSAVTALHLGDEQLALVAQVDLSCDAPGDCDALGIEALPIAEANVNTGVMVDCPPSDIEPDCVPMAAPVPSVYGSSQRQYFYVLDLDAPDGPAWQAWGQSSLESSTARRDGGGFSRFAAPIATDGVLAATRLERESATGVLLPRGTSRFMLDRFGLDAQGAPQALPPVNVPGYPLARLGTRDGVERWVAVEASPDASGHARVMRLDIDGGGATVVDELALDAGTFAGMRVIASEGSQVGVALLTPGDACGNTQVSALGLGSSERLALVGQLDLPEDDWTFAGSDGPYVLLRHFPAYVLVHVAADASLDIVGSRTVSDVVSEQLIGTTLFSADAGGPQRIDFEP